MLKLAVFFIICIALFAKPTQPSPNPKAAPTSQDSTISNATLSISVTPTLESTTLDTLLSLKYNIGFDFLLDNTEGSEVYWATRTLYAIKLAPEIGLSIGRKHALMIGGYAIQNMGANTFPTKANISAYYCYKDDRFRTIFGIFPRTYWIGQYPLSFFRYDFLFLNPNTNGLLLQYRSKEESIINGYVEFIFDWFGGNLDKRYDEFFVLFSGRMNFLKNYGFVGANALIYHFKNADVLGQDNEMLNGQPNTQLMDKIYYNVFLGVDFKPLLKVMDKAQVQFGTLSSLERKRKISALEPFYNGLGWEASIKAQFRGFGIEESYYFGKPQMRYYSNYGESFYNGLPFYRASNFNRVSVYYEYKNTWLKTNISFIFYSMPNSTLALQQMLTLSIDTQDLLKKR